MSSSSTFKEMIERMVEEAIRRVLPSVMNEVLLRTIADSGVLTETRPVKPRKPPKKRRPVREVRAPQRSAGSKLNRKFDLGDLLDESAGADFYRDPRAAMAEAASDDVVVDEPIAAPARNARPSRLEGLSPELRGLAEGMVLDEDDEEMWGEGEHDSVPMAEGIAADPTPIRDVDRAAKAAGVDFSRMKSLIARTAPRIDRREAAEDARARAQFEQARIARLRDKLGGVKPPE